MTTETYTISASGKASIPKDPAAVLDYAIDLSEWLELVSDTLAPAGLTVVASGATVDSSLISGTKCVAWISGGTVGETAVVTFIAETTGGRTYVRRIYLKIKEL